MKRINLLKLANIFLIVGFLCVVVSLAMTNVNQRKLGITYSAFINDFSAEFDSAQKIVIDVGDHFARVVESKGDKIIVTAYNAEKEYYTAIERDGVITVGFTDARKWYERIYTSTPDGLWDSGVDIAIPANANLHIQANVKNDSIQLLNFTILGDITINSQSSYLFLNNISAANLNVDFTFNNKLSASVGNKKISIKDANFSGEIKLLGHNQNINIDKLNCFNLNIENSNATNTLSHVTVQKQGSISGENSQVELFTCDFKQSINVKTSTKNITLAALKSPSITLATINAEISGTVDGKKDEYNVECDTNQSCTIWSRNIAENEKWIRVKTLNADIKIAFSE